MNIFQFDGKEFDKKLDEIFSNINKLELKSELIECGLEIEPDKYTQNAFEIYKDCNRQNNKVDNLEWCTHKENTQYSIKYGNSQNLLRRLKVFRETQKRKVNQYSINGVF